VWSRGSGGAEYEGREMRMEGLIVRWFVGLVG